jgi:uncharacterized membrane protein
MLKNSTWQLASLIIPWVYYHTSGLYIGKLFNFLASYCGVQHRNLENRMYINKELVL